MLWPFASLVFRILLSRRMLIPDPPSSSRLAWRPCQLCVIGCTTTPFPNEPTAHRLSAGPSRRAAGTSDPSRPGAETHAPQPVAEPQVGDPPPASSGERLSSPSPEARHTPRDQ